MLYPCLCVWSLVPINKPLDCRDCTFQPKCQKYTLNISWKKSHVHFSVLGWFDFDRCLLVYFNAIEVHTWTCSYYMIEKPSLLVKLTLKGQLLTILTVNGTKFPAVDSHLFLLVRTVRWVSWKPRYFESGNWFKSVNHIDIICYWNTKLIRSNRLKTVTR